MTADLLSARWDPGDAGLAAVWLPGGFEVEYAEPGGREVRARLDRLHRVDLGSCLPVRSFPSYKGQRNYPRWPLANDPVRWWIRYHRARFGQLRYRPWDKPPPENRHFK